MKDKREWIKVTTDFPRHPKTVALSDAAFRILIMFWCYSMEYKTDGFLHKNYVRSTAKPRLLNELKTQGFLSENSDKKGFTLHDYTKHQATSEEREEARKAKSEAGLLGSHKKNHVNKNIYDETCGYCTGA